MNIIFTGDISFDWLPQPGLLKQLLPNHSPSLSNLDTGFFKKVARELGISGIKAMLLKSKVDYQTNIISSGLSDLFNSADFVCANLECAMTNRGEALPGKKFTLRAEPYYLAALKKLNISAVYLANNHILDYGPDGLNDTLKYLKIAGINYCGLKHKTDELDLKLQLKRLGGNEFKAESQELIQQVDAQLANLDSQNKDDKKKITPLNKDKATLEARLAKTDGILATIGGQLTEEESRRLILKKLYDIAHQELNRYLNVEKRGLVQVVENLWDKYGVPSRELESERIDTLRTLNGFLKGLGYLG